MKRCLRCGVEKPDGEFYPARPGALTSRCKQCHGVEARACVVCTATFVGKAGRICCSPACRTSLCPPTYKTCQACKGTFGPVDHLDRRFCSHACAYKARATGRRTLRKTIRKARNAQSLVRYHVLAGHIIRPSACQQCGTTARKIEAAHFNYDEPLRVRWLCKSCHARWDKKEPKGATYVVPIAPEAEPATAAG
jgi:hypothetical protein